MAAKAEQNSFSLGILALPFFIVFMAVAAIGTAPVVTRDRGAEPEQVGASIVTDSF
ncbi:hypothetical protein IFT69_15450 [Pseudomonas putida]|nr:hypothetical protein [Pseudomonas putida]